MKTSRLNFRKFSKTDFKDYYQLVSNIDVMKMITGEVISQTEAEERFNTLLTINYAEKNAGYYHISAIENDTFVGLGKIIFTKKDEVEIGFMLLPQFWGKGFGSEISQELVTAAKRIESVKTLMAIIDPVNLASKKILMGSGFKLDEVSDYQGLPAEFYRLHL